VSHSLAPVALILSLVAERDRLAAELAEQEGYPGIAHDFNECKRKLESETHDYWNAKRERAEALEARDAALREAQQLRIELESLKLGRDAWKREAWRLSRD
jgi:hypothetical protein